MARRTDRQHRQSASDHDDVSILLYSLLPLFLAVLLFVIFNLYGALVEPENRIASIGGLCLAAVCVGVATVHFGGPVKFLEQLSPPRQVVARRRAPKVYEGLLRRRWCCRCRHPAQRQPASGDASETGRVPGQERVPALNVLIMITGTHGDVAPFVALAHELHRRYGHRIRFATHLTHRDYVVGAGLDFYPLAGDPRILSKWMVQSQGRLLPDINAPLTTLREEVSEVMPAKLAMINDIMESTWPACVDELPEEMAAGRPRFVAHAIISNPVTYGHIHCASALNIPLHLAFPQPWTPTDQYPHPFVRGTLMPNRYTFTAFDELTAMGLNLNQWRTEELNLPPLLAGDRGAHVLNDLCVPFSYLWSPALSPKPPDWGPHVDVLGTLLHDTASACEYQPSPELERFLNDGPKPVFVGFGSMVVDNPGRLFEMLVEAAARTEVRMIVQSSWSRIGGDGDRLPQGMHLIAGCPHSWLLPKCSAVIHHGGAGTVAAGLRFGLPTFVVPFFGDQHFWGHVVRRAGAGPSPCPYSELSSDCIVAAIEQLRTPEVCQRAAVIAEAMSREDGIGAMCDSFTRNLPISDMVCSVSLFAGTEPRVVVAEQWHPSAGLKLSQEAHAVLQASPLSTWYSCEYSYILWDIHAPAFLGNGFLMVVSSAAENSFGVIWALLSPILEVSRFISDWRDKGARAGACDLVGSSLLVFVFACCSMPIMFFGSIFGLINRLYMALMEFLLRTVMIPNRLLVHVRARHQCIRSAVDVACVPRERREDLVRAFIVAEHVFGAIALVQCRFRGKVKRRLSRRELLRALCLLSRCPPPERYSNRCVRAARRLRRLCVYAKILCSASRLDQASCLRGWEVGEGMSTVDFCVQYGESLRRLSAPPEDRGDEIA